MTPNENSGLVKRPAIICVGFQDVYSDQTYDLKEQYAATRRLTDAARMKNIRIFYTHVGYNANGADLGSLSDKYCDEKIAARAQHPFVWNQNIDVREADVLLEKHRPSVFFGTPLLQMLVPMYIDTLIFCSGMPGGGISASILDSCSYSFRTIILKDAVDNFANEADALFAWSVGRKYGAVSDVCECIKHFESLDPLEYEFQYNQYMEEL